MPTVARIGRHGIVQHRHPPFNRWNWPWEYHTTARGAHRNNDHMNPTWVDMNGNSIVPTPDMVQEYNNALAGPTAAWNLWNTYTRRGISIPSTLRIPIMDSLGIWTTPEGVISLTRPTRQGVPGSYTWVVTPPEYESSSPNIWSGSLASRLSRTNPNRTVRFTATVRNTPAPAPRRVRRRVHNGLSEEARAAIMSSVSGTRRFGIEIECIANTNELIEIARENGLNIQTEDYNHHTRRHWKIVTDGSLHYRGGRAGYSPIEIVSPPLSGPEGMEEVEKMCLSLRQANTIINRSCGLHVHHDASDVTLAGVRTLAQNWCNNQLAIDTVLSPSRRADGENSYCMSFTQEYCNRITARRNLSEAMDAAGTRYLSLNFTSYSRHGTIEVRQHQGSIEFSKISHWILLGQLMIAKSFEGNIFPRTTNFSQTLVNFGAPQSMIEYYEDRRRQLNTFVAYEGPLVAVEPEVTPATSNHVEMLTWSRDLARSFTEAIDDRTMTTVNTFAISHAAREEVAMANSIADTFSNMIREGYLRR